jgi:hypothetical protein
MKSLAVLIVSAVAIAAQQPATNNGKPSALGPRTPVRNSSAQQAPAGANTETADDPFPDELKAALDAEREWKRLDMSLNAQLEGAQVCTEEPTNLINDAASARVRSLAAFGDYYSKHESRWRDAANYALNTASDRAPDRSEIVSAIGALSREKADLERRQSALNASLAGQDSPEARKTIADLSAMIGRKTSQLARSEETLRLFDSAQDYLKQRREFARVRLREIAELIEDLKGESLLWEHLYRGMLHSWQLRCDKATPGPTSHDNGYWQTRGRI